MTAPLIYAAAERIQTTGHDSSLLTAALDALPESLFLVDCESETALPLNASAATWAGRPQGDWLPIAKLFPQLSVPNPCQNADDRSHLDGDELPHLTRALQAMGDAHPDFEVRVHPLAGSSGKVVVVARKFAHSMEPSDVAPRDALDDAFHDPLTRLANRRLFQRRLERAIDRASRSSYHFAVLFVDLDGFKQVNDRFGHLHGDHVLVAAAHRLVEAVRPQDMVARRDGDEFTILLDDLERPQDAVRVAERIIERLQLPLSSDGPAAAAVCVGASIGIAMASDSLSSADELIARADSAMYHAKALGGGTFVTLDRAAPDAKGIAASGEKPLPR